MNLHQLLAALTHGTDVRFDADETAFLERSLTHVRTKVHQVEYADLMARSFVPMATDIPPSADTYVFPVLDRVGEARVISAKGMDIPRVDVSLTEVTGKVYTVADAYGFDLYEMQNAARVGVPLSQWKASVAREALERKVDEMLALGSPADQQGLNITGLINNAAVEAAGVANFTHWIQGTTDAQTIVDELHAFVNAIPVATLQKFIPNTLALPPSRFVIAATTTFVETDTNALTSFLKNNPYITSVAQWHRLEDAGAGGLDRAITYKRDPMVLEGVIPQEFLQLPPQAQGLEMVTNCTMRAGGVKVYQPAAMAYGDFADS